MQKISSLLHAISGEPPVLVSSHDHDSDSKIERFRKSSSKWLVSVGMVSEGTDIPRLQVCCHLSRIRTELHFRQVLGRILRVRKQDKKSTAEFIVPAHDELTIFAKQLLDEIPGSADFLKYQTFEPNKTPPTLEGSQGISPFPEQSANNHRKDSDEEDTIPKITSQSTEPKRYDQNERLTINVGVYGRYIEQVMRYWT